MMTNLLAVGAGGAAGSMLRFFCQHSFSTPTFPYGTLLVNIVGCFLAGLLAGYFLKTAQHTSLSLFLITGFCGGFTTFSAFSLEAVQLAQKGQWMFFCFYVAGSVLIGLLAAFWALKIIA